MESAFQSSRNAKRNDPFLDARGRNVKMKQAAGCWSHADGSNLTATFMGGYAMANRHSSRRRSIAAVAYVRMSSDHRVAWKSRGHRESQIL